MSDSPAFDWDGYPTDDPLMEYVREAWSSYGWFEQQPGKFELHTLCENDVPWACATGGWSGNESIIAALEENLGFWWTCWECSARGGYYEFHLKVVE